MSSFGLFGLKTIPEIRQSEASECGLVCIAIIAAYHGYSIDLPSLRQKFPTSLMGTTLKQIVDIARTLGLNSRALKGNIEHLRKVQFPAILHFDFNHFVVIESITKRFLGEYRYNIIDPAAGRLQVSREEMSRRWTGVILEVSKSIDFAPKKERKSMSLGQMWSSVHGFWPTLSRAFLLSAILQVVVLSFPFYMQIAIDTALPSSDSNLLKVLAIGFLLLATLEFCTNWLRGLVVLSLTNSLSYQITVNLFRHLLSLPLPWFEKRHTGDVVSRFGSTQPISQMLSTGAISALIDGILAFLTLIIMIVYSIQLTVLAAFAVVLYLFLKVIFFRALQLRNINSISASAVEQSVFIESIRGIYALKAFGQENNRLRIWQDKKIKAVNASMMIGRMGVGFDSLSKFISSAEKIAFIYFAVNISISGVMTIGMIFAFQAYKQHFVDASVRLIDQAMNLKLSQVHLGRISDIALSRPELGHESNAGENDQRIGSINLEGVGFRYGVGEMPVFSDVNINIEPGEMVALVGPSGGGKTTLMKIMMGLFDPTVGSVSIDGISFSRLSRSRFRQRIGSIAQNDMLYAGTMAENIAFFDQDMNFDRVIEVAKLAHIHEDIKKMPLGYQTLVGDMGSVLSGGQKQRVLLARALYPNPDYIFMDEGTANLDEQSENLVLSTLESLSVTRVVIAHRRRAIDAADRIVFVANGRVLRAEKQS